MKQQKWVVGDKMGIMRMGAVTTGVALTALSLSAPVRALVSSIQGNGIDAQRLHDAPYNLTGRKIAIGQVEIGRPSDPGLDKAGSSNHAVQVHRVLEVDKPAAADVNVDDHAASVASIMISRDKQLRGVAPDAVLYSAALGMEGDKAGQLDDCIATQAVAEQNGGDVRAINFSFGLSLQQDNRPNSALDGNSLLTQCVDWSARIHNVVYVISGNQGRGGFPIPTDSFNGITVADSQAIRDTFDRVGFASLGSQPAMVIGGDPDKERNVGPRRSVSLVAPGDRIPTIGPDGSNAAPASGTSFAAPHVTATVALLQQFGDAAIRSALKSPNSHTAAHWTLDARRQEVMRAVLMNSADKVRDGGDGSRLGMTRTLTDLQNRNWLESDAYQDPKIPLDANLGTGHLNAYRAYEQFSPGQWSPQAAVPAIGWDYGSITRRGSDRVQDYVIDQPLQGGSFISATLSWNRWVDLQDTNGNGQFDTGELFQDQGLNNLDLYLMRADDDRTEDSIWSSVSEVDSIEHIFHQIPETGRYKIRVVYRDRVNDNAQSYGLAWWAKPAL